MNKYTYLHTYKENALVLSQESDDYVVVSKKDSNDIEYQDYNKLL